MIEAKDKRVRRTKKLLYHELAILMKEKSIDEITVTELTKRCHMNRSTFYLHYSDIHEMVRKAEDSIIGRMEVIFSRED